MKFLKNPFTRVALIIVFLVLIGWNIKVKYLNPQPVPAARYIPVEGVSENDTGGKVQGDPNNAISDFKRIYTFISVYRNRHNGAYPSKPSDILLDMNTQEAYDAYGIKAHTYDAFDIFTNPDTAYSDDPSARKFPANSIKYHLYSKRPDGSVIGSTKPLNTHDIIAETDIYFHKNVRRYPGGKSTSNPVGFYVVMYEDGIIQKIPYDHLLFVPKGDGDFAMTFPGQAGIPSNAMTYDEFYRMGGWKKGPRGSEGAPGLNYRGKTLPQ